MSRPRTKVLKLPRSVPVGGSRVRISVIKHMTDWGNYLHDERRIKINIECFAIKGKVKAILRHELQHAALSISGVAFMDKFDEEAVVRCFDEIFFPMWDKLCEKYDL
jgi:hypothetical protein